MLLDYIIWNEQKKVNVNGQHIIVISKEWRKKLEERDSINSYAITEINRKFYDKLKKDKFERFSIRRHKNY